MEMTSHPFSGPKTGSLIASPARRYGIVKRRRLPRSWYYDALDLTCAACGRTQDRLPPDGLCLFCRSPLTPVLIHAHPAEKGEPAEETAARLLHLSAGHPAIIPHQAIFVVQGPAPDARLLCTAIAHPGRWGVLVRGRRQRSLREALGAFLPVAQAILYLHTHRFAHHQPGQDSLEGLITVGGGNDVRLADLSGFRPFASDPAGIRHQVERDLLFLANLLTFLATGQEFFRGGQGLLPGPLVRPVERAARGEYASVGDMLADLNTVLLESPRPLRPVHGQATHPGRQRSGNEDAVASVTLNLEQEGQTLPVGLYLVADGMGGHAAGDLASRIVTQRVTARLVQEGIVPKLRQWQAVDVSALGNLLVQAIQHANGDLIHYARETGSDLGSTLTAALIAGDAAFVANVGDSRTYLLRDNRLTQITRDHSLVARLAEAGIIRPEEIRTHPRRNEIYRSLGHHAQVEVDLFPLTLQRGDRLILCSDGLWEMVPDDKIRQVVQKARTPQQACDALIEAANQAGGEDNITVIVVEME